jgi:hypothetical protein
MRSGGLGSTQDAGDRARLLEAPCLIVLAVVVVPSWRWRQWRQASGALGTVLTRLATPGTVARWALPAVLARLIAPALPGVAVIPAASTTASSTAIAAVVALGPAANAPVADCPELLAVVGIVAVDVMECAVRTAFPGARGLAVATATLHLWLRGEHGRTFALYLLSFGLLVFGICLRELQEGEATFLCHCAPGR